MHYQPWMAHCKQLILNGGTRLSIYHYSEQFNDGLPPSSIWVIHEYRLGWPVQIHSGELDEIIDEILYEDD